ncbi:MAG: transporter [Microbacteriaceae bacterium]
MVATLVRLRFLLLRNQLARSPWQIVATVLGGLYGLFVLGALVVALVALSFADIEFARTVTVLAGAAVILGWMLLPALTSGVDQTVDPGRLATFPIARDTLLLGLAVSGVLGIPGIVTLIASLATAATWWRHPLAAIIAVLCAVIATCTAVFGSRMVVALASRISVGRRAREAKTLVVMIPLILLGPIIIGVTALLREVSDLLPSIARVVALTPFGAIWAVPGDVAAGRFGIAALEFVIGLATLVVVVLLWRWGLARALEQPTQASTKTQVKKGLGLFGRFPGTPVGAVAARALTYWVRDPRYAQSLISIPLVPLFVFVYSGFGDNLTPLVFVGPIVAVLLAMSIYTDVSYDNTAFALHVQTGVDGRSDRLGRVIALAVFSVPVTLLLLVGTVAFTGEWGWFPGLLGITIGIFCSGFAVSSIVSGRFVFAVPAPGESPFKSKPGAGMSLLLSTFLSWSVVGLLVLPSLVLAIIGFATGQALFGWLALLVGVVWGAVQLVLGIRIGGRILDRRAPEMLAQLRLQK